MYDQKVNNKVVYPALSRLNVRELPSITSTALTSVEKNQSPGRTTGGMFKMKDGDWYQVLFSKPIKGKEYGYVKANSVKLVEGKNDISTEQAQSLVNNLIKTDQDIYKSLLSSANILNNLKKKGIDTTSYDKTYKGLLDRHTERQNEIKNSKLLTWKQGLDKTQTGLLEGFKSYLLSTYGISIGVIPVIGAIVFAAVGAGLATAAYFAFRPKYDEGIKDLKISKDLETALAKVDPQTAQKIKEDLGKQIDTAYNSGKTAGTFSGMFSIVKPIAIGLLGFWAVSKFIQHNSK